MLFTPDWTNGSVLDLTAKPLLPGRWLGGTDGRLRFDHETGYTLCGTMLLCGYYNADTGAWTAYDFDGNGTPTSKAVPVDTVIGLAPQDTGYYPLLATMKGNKTFAVLIGNTPLVISSGTLAVPENLHDLDITAYSITMGWDYTDDAQIYIIRYRTDEGAWTNKSSSALWTEISSLTPDTMYEFQLCAKNDYGESEWSSSVYAATLELD